MQPLLSIKNLHVTVDNKEILKGVDLKLNAGEVHAIMGPNGSGKSSLALTMMGHPNYRMTGGCITFLGEDIAALKPNERAALGLFLSFQQPVAIPGVSIANLTRTAYKQLHAKNHVDIKTFRARINDTLAVLHQPATFLDRSVNDGFSGGEKKIAEMVQLAMLEPKLALLDEIDSGLDIDALQRIAGIVQTLRSSERSFVFITHHSRLLGHIKPDAVHVLVNGTIVRSGGYEIAEELEKSGYEQYQEQ